MFGRKIMCKPTKHRKYIIHFLFRHHHLCSFVSISCASTFMFNNLSWAMWAGNLFSLCYWELVYPFAENKGWRGEEKWKCEWVNCEWRRKECEWRQMGESWMKTEWLWDWVNEDGTGLLGWANVSRVHSLLTPQKNWGEGVEGCAQARMRNRLSKQ